MEKIDNWLIGLRLEQVMSLVLLTLSIVLTLSGHITEGSIWLATVVIMQTIIDAAQRVIDETKQ